MTKRLTAQLWQHMVIVSPTVRRFIIRIKTAHFTLRVKNCFYTHTHTHTHTRACWQQNKSMWQKSPKHSHLTKKRRRSRKKHFPSKLFAAFRLEPGERQEAKRRPNHCARCVRFGFCACLSVPFWIPPPILPLFPFFARSIPRPKALPAAL